MNTSELADTELVPAGERRESRNHIACDCRPLVMFCGAYCDASPINEMPDGDECAECYRIWRSGVCGNCGNTWDEAKYQALGLT